MWNSIQSAYRVHGRSMFNAEFWVVAIYRYGRWAQTLRLWPWRKLNGLVYVVLHQTIYIFTRVHFERGVQAGEDLHVIHAMSINVHPGVVVGDRCGIMHGVTIGSNQGSVSAPRLGNDVFLGCNASVLGDITIGDNVRVAANTLVITDIPSGSVAMGVPAKVYPNMDLLRKNSVKRKRRRTTVNSTGESATELARESE